METDPSKTLQNVLLVRAGAQTCALPLAQVVEIMRPLPVCALADAPEVVRGLAVIRGAALAVVSLDQVLLPRAGSAPPAGAARFVVVRTGSAQVALAVEEVLGVRQVRASLLRQIPPLVQHAAREAIDAIAALDSELLLVLKTGRLVPDEVRDTLAAAVA